MSDLFYNLVWYVGHHAFWLTSTPTVVGAEVTRRPGAFILASNHAGPYDIPLLMRHTYRNLDFVSIVEVFRNPVVGWFYGSMNAFPLDRTKPDSPTVRIILDRLAKGRAVAMFPEGGFREEADSVVTGGRMRSGIARLAQLANVPIIPAVIIGSNQYRRLPAWIPIRQTRYGIIYGQPLEVRSDLPKTEAAQELEARLRQSFVQLNVELKATMKI